MGVFIIYKLVEKIYDIFKKVVLKEKLRKAFYQHPKRIIVGSDFEFNMFNNIVNIDQTAKIEIGNSVHFRNFCNIWVDKNSTLNLGSNVFFNNYCSINALGKISIGDYSIFGENVKLFDHNHLYLDTSIPIQFQGCKIGEITIGRNCWIGSNVIILKNVNIGDNVVIGAGNLIYKDVPSNVIIKSQTNYLSHEYRK